MRVKLFFPEALIREPIKSVCFVWSVHLSSGLFSCMSQLKD